ncbi:MAG: matrixin family metalloprotease [Methylococcales bacterium]
MKAQKFTTKRLVLLICLLVNAGSAFAYNFYETGNPDKPYNKWGPDAPGTGATITWSFIPAGTPGSIFCGATCDFGSSTDQLYMYSDPDLGIGDLVSLASLKPSIENAFNTWASVANLTFIYNPTDSGAAINDPGATPPATGHIRIGAFADGIYGAVGYAPPPNGGTGEGDILFNSSFYFQNTNNAEGTLLNTTYAPNDFSGLFLHELGHALGINHSSDTSAVMCGIPPASTCDYSHINRILEADDIAAIQTLYGAPVPLPASFWLLSSGLLAVFGKRHRRFLANSN